MEVIQMPPVHAANQAANRGNTAYGVDVIVSTTCFISPYQLLIPGLRTKKHGNGVKVRSAWASDLWSLVI